MVCLHTAPSFGNTVPFALGIGLGLILVPNMFQPVTSHNRIVKTVIICLRCRGKNTEDSKFCGHCGHSLYPQPQVQCPKCSETVPSMKFCLNCGTKLKK